MTDLASWAPLATGGAALIGALVTWSLGASRHQRLKLAIEVADRIPREQRDDWGMMIYRDAERIMEAARRPRWIIFVYVLGWGALSVSTLVPDELFRWFAWGGGALAAVSTVAMVLAFRGERRDAARRQDRQLRMIADLEARETELLDRRRKQEERSRNQAGYTAWLLRSQGASRLEAAEATNWDRLGDIDYGQAWVSLVESRKRSLAWRVRRARFRDPAPQRLGRDGGEE